MYQNNFKNILIRANSSFKIGIGHIMRDLILVKQFTKSNIHFATQNLQGNINSQIVQAGYKIKLLKSNDIEELDHLIKYLKIDLLVIDSYDIDIKYEKQLKKLNPNLQIMVLDDTYEAHHCDILLNHNIYAKKKKYKNKVPKNCKLLCGKKYTLLRDEFKKQKNKISKNKSDKTKIFLAMGGADTANLNIKILKVLEKFENIKVNIVSTSANKNLSKLKKYCKNKSHLKLDINSNKIAKLMAKSTLGIITPSVTANEASFMNLPFISIKTASNQKYMYKYLKNTALALKKFDSKELKKLLKKLIK